MTTTPSTGSSEATPVWRNTTTTTSAAIRVVGGTREPDLPVPVEASYRRGCHSRSTSGLATSWSRDSKCSPEMSPRALPHLHDVKFVQIGDNFAILPSSRGHGLGTKLMNAILTHARSHQIKSLHTTYPSWCPDWTTFYSRFHFQVVPSNSSNPLTDLASVTLELT